MNSAIQELYDNYRQSPKKYPPDSPYHESICLLNRNLDKLMEQLNDSEKVTLEKFCDAQGELEDITHYAAFSDGIKFGLLLMAEAYSQEGG